MKELRERLAYIERELSRLREANRKARPGAAKDNRSRFIGCLEFQRLQIESELAE